MDIRSTLFFPRQIRASIRKPWASQGLGEEGGTKKGLRYGLINCNLEGDRAGGPILVKIFAQAFCFFDSTTLAKSHGTERIESSIKLGDTPTKKNTRVLVVNDGVTGDVTLDFLFLHSLIIPLKFFCFGLTKLLITPLLKLIW